MVPLPRTRTGAGPLLVGMVHLGALPGQEGFAGWNALLERAAEDARALEAAGFDALVVENWRDESPGPFVGPEVVAAFGRVLAAVRAASALPLGVNVLPNDYRAAFGLAAAWDLAFVWLDVLVDRVRTDYAVSRAAPFEVAVDRDDLARWRERLGARGVGLWASVHPKHYRLLDERPLEASVALAPAWGADAVVVTGAATGSAPDPARVARAAVAAAAARGPGGGAGVPLLVGSGLDPANAAALLGAGAPGAGPAGAIVGTSVKTPDFARVDPARARALVAAARG